MKQAIKDLIVVKQDRGQM